MYTSIFTCIEKYLYTGIDKKEQKYKETTDVLKLSVSHSQAKETAIECCQGERDDHRSSRECDVLQGNPDHRGRACGQGW